MKSPYSVVLIQFTRTLGNDNVEQTKLRLSVDFL